MTMTNPVNKFYDTLLDDGSGGGEMSSTPILEKKPQSLLEAIESPDPTPDQRGALDSLISRAPAVLESVQGSLNVSQVTTLLGHIFDGNMISVSSQHRLLTFLKDNQQQLVKDSAQFISLFERSMNMTGGLICTDLKNGSSTDTNAAVIVEAIIKKVEDYNNVLGLESDPSNYTSAKHYLLDKDNNTLYLKNQDGQPITVPLYKRLDDKNVLSRTVKTMEPLSDRYMAFILVDDRNENHRMIVDTYNGTHSLIDDGDIAMTESDTIDWFFKSDDMKHIGDPNLLWFNDKLYSLPSRANRGITKLTNGIFTKDMKSFYKTHDGELFVFVYNGAYDIGCDPKDGLFRFYEKQIKKRLIGKDKTINHDKGAIDGLNSPIIGISRDRQKVKPISDITTLGQ